MARDPHNSDRDAILARRALLISAALAGLACTTHSAEPNTGVASATEPGTPEGLAPWAKVMAAAPPLDVPTNLSDEDHALMSRQVAYLSSLYEQVEAHWNVVPDCRPSEAECEAWAEAVELIDDLSEDDSGPLCAYPPAVSNTYVERRRAHHAYLASLAKRLTGHLDRAAARHTSSADSEAWASLRARIQVSPQPCLDCAMPRAQAITDALAFAEGEAKLGSSKAVERTLQHVVETHARNSGTTLIVRGHADPHEPAPTELARARAETVIARLVELGVSADELELRTYGARLSLTHSSADAARNRRVDFEVELED